MNWASIITAGIKFAPAILAAVDGVERYVTAAHGKDKQDAAVAAVTTATAAAGDVAGLQLLADPDVERAVRDAIDAYVALRNVLARKGAPAAVPVTA